MMTGRATVTLGEEPVWYNDVSVSPGIDHVRGRSPLQLFSLLSTKKKCLRNSLIRITLNYSLNKHLARL